MNLTLDEIRAIVREVLSEKMFDDGKGGKVCPECGESEWAGHHSTCSKYGKKEEQK